MAGNAENPCIASPVHLIKISRGYGVRWRDPSTKGLFDGPALPAEEMRAVGANVQAVFESYAEFARDGDGGFITEAHAHSDGGFISFHEVGPFMPFHADAVTGAVGEAGQAIVFGESGIFDHFSRCGINDFAGGTDFN